MNKYLSYFFNDRLKKKWTAPEFIEYIRIEYLLRRSRLKIFRLLHNEIWPSRRAIVRIQIAQESIEGQASGYQKQPQPSDSHLCQLKMDIELIFNFVFFTLSLMSEKISSIYVSFSLFLHGHRNFSYIYYIRYKTRLARVTFPSH